MELSSFANTAFADGVELRFGRQPLDAARAAGLEFHDIDKAALEAGAAADVGAMFVAEMPGWGIVCQRPKARVIRVLRMMPARATHTGAVHGPVPGRDAGIGRSGRGHDDSTLQGVADRRWA